MTRFNKSTLGECTELPPQRFTPYTKPKNAVISPLSSDETVELECFDEFVLKNEDNNKITCYGGTLFLITNGEFQEFPECEPSGDSGEFVKMQRCKIKIYK